MGHHRPGTLAARTTAMEIQSGLHTSIPLDRQIQRQRPSDRTNPTRSQIVTRSGYLALSGTLRSRFWRWRALQGIDLVDTPM